MKYQYILSLGSNVGEREKNLSQVKNLLRERDIRILSECPPIETRPILQKNQPIFLNSALKIQTNLEPNELLTETLSIESRIGRKRRVRFGPREIDIDIVWWSGGKFCEKTLVIPHRHNRARFWVRKFMAELNSNEKDTETGVAYANMNVKSITRIQDFPAKKKLKEKITMLTCYDFSMGRLLARTSIDCVLVGDSLGNVIQGEKNTLPVTLDDIIYHTRAVRRAMPETFIVADMPFLSYQISPEQAVENAGKVLKETGCSAIKLEGGEPIIPTIEKLVKTGIPVMGHLGLTPQSVLALGGYRVQGRGTEGEALSHTAKRLEQAGVFSLVLEMVPAPLAKEVSQNLEIPVIGIGAGPDTDGQVLVIHDLLGMDPDFKPRFVRHYDNLAERIMIATEKYCEDVRTKAFPGQGELFE